MFWSPVVRQGLIGNLQKIGFDKLFINKEYKDAIQQLRAKAASQKRTLTIPHSDYCKFLNASAIEK
jgi:hypothetical protein